MTDFSQICVFIRPFLKSTFLKTSIVLMWLVPAGAFFPQDFFLKNKHCAHIARARRVFSPQKTTFQLSMMCLVDFLMI